MTVRAWATLYVANIVAGALFAAFLFHALDTEDVPATAYALVGSFSTLVTSVVLCFATSVKVKEGAQ